MRYLLVLLLTYTLAGAAELPRVRPADWAQPVIGTTLKNFCKVSDDLYRSAQPEDAEMAMLERMGVRSVLNLREYHSDEDEAEKTSLRRYRIRMDAGDIRQEQIAEAVRILRDCPKPVLVHCWHGSDRTGCVVAVYRMVFQGWPRDKAIDEFSNGGFGYHESIYPNIEKYLAAVDVEALKRIAAGK